MIEAQPQLRVIGEAADGWEAVRKVQMLKPDLILLDIGLPTLDGIETANRIRQNTPSTRIIFLSQNNDKDIVRAAWALGRKGMS
jgi:two-component system nitrate/nitrite response regulator NarL